MNQHFDRITITKPGDRNTNVGVYVEASNPDDLDAIVASVKYDIPSCVVREGEVEGGKRAPILKQLANKDYRVYEDIKSLLVQDGWDLISEQTPSELNRAYRSTFRRSNVHVSTIGDQLEKLSRLFSSGMLSREEFAQAKRKLLG